MFDPFLLAAPLLLAPLVGLLRFIGCTDAFTSSTTPPPPLGVEPALVGLGPGEQQKFFLKNDEEGIDVTWESVLKRIDANSGLYTAPDVWMADSDHVTAKQNDIPIGSAAVTLLHAAVEVTPPVVTLMSKEQKTFTAVVKPTPHQEVKWTSPDEPTAIEKDSGLFTAPSPFVLGAGSIHVRADSLADASAFDEATVNLIGNGAVFIEKNIDVQGDWNSKGMFGTAGYVLAGEPNIKQLPGYLPTVDVDGLTVKVWADPDPDPKGLEKPPALATRFSATWYDSDVLTLDLNFEDFKTHRIAIYFIDWDSGGRKQTVELLDNSQPLDKQNLSDFSGGQYLIWDVSGQVRVSVTRTAEANAVMSGIFFQ